MSDGRRKLEISDSEVEVELGGAVLEQLAVAGDELILRAPTPDERAPLRARAQRLADALPRHLGGPLDAQEISARQGLAVLRTPEDAIVRRRYWQVEHRDDGSTTVQRVAVGEDGARQRDRFSFTREQLDALVETVRDASERPADPKT